MFRFSTGNIQKRPDAMVFANCKRYGNYKGHLKDVSINFANLESDFMLKIHVHVRNIDRNMKKESVFIRFDILYCDVAEKTNPLGRMS